MFILRDILMEKGKLERQKNHYFPNFPLAKIICGLYIDDPQVDILKIFNLFLTLIMSGLLLLRVLHFQ